MLMVPFVEFVEHTMSTTPLKSILGVFRLHIHLKIRKAVGKMREHQKSAHHIRCNEAMVMTSTQGSVAYIQKISTLERAKHRATLKSLVSYTHFLVRYHIAHSTNFIDLVELVVSCGARQLQTFIESASKNAVYTSLGAVVKFIQALGTWTKESLLSAIFHYNGGVKCTSMSLIKKLSVSVSEKKMV